MAKTIMIIYFPSRLFGRRQIASILVSEIADKQKRGHFAEPMCNIQQWRIPIEQLHPGEARHRAVDMRFRPVATPAIRDRRQSPVAQRNAGSCIATNAIRGTHAAPLRSGTGIRIS
jgi:hypothetical protein